jgi:histidine ammonia-lyase
MTAARETVMLRSRSDFNLENYRRVAWEGHRVALAPAALDRMAETRASFLRMVESDPDAVIYGTTTGDGDRVRFQRFSRAEREERGRRVARGTMAWGDPLPERVVRGIVFARLTNWIEGHGAVRPELAQRIATMLDDGPLPEIPGRGHGGAGETTALHPLFGPVAYEFGTEIKEPMELYNGSPASASLLADAALRARRRLALAHDVFALSCEGFLVPLGAYDEALEELWGDIHESAALRSIRERLEGGVPEDERLPYQAPVCWRIIPRVLGQAHRAVARIEEAAEISLRSVSDNPVYIAPDDEHPHGRVLGTGGYHNGMAYPALDELAASWADMAQLCERQTERFLAPLEHGNFDVMEGFLKIQAAWAEEARAAAQTTLIGLAGLGQNDTSAPSFFAWEREGAAADAFERALTIVAILAADELHRAKRDPSPPLRPFLDELRRHFPPEGEYLGRGKDAERLHAAFAERVSHPDAPLARC